MTTTYNTGDVRPTSSTLAAPTPVLTVTAPDGTSSTPAVSGAPGAYTASYTLTQTGRYLERWVNSGGVQSDIVNTLPADPGFLVSLAEVKLALNKSTTADDDELRAYIAAATSPIEALGGAVVINSHGGGQGGGTGHRFHAFLVSYFLLVIIRADQLDIGMKRPLHHVANKAGKQYEGGDDGIGPKGAAGS